MQKVNKALEIKYKPKPVLGKPKMQVAKTFDVKKAPLAPPSPPKKEPPIIKKQPYIPSKPDFKVSKGK